jgi:hypothetical protein
MCISVDETYVSDSAERIQLSEWEKGSETFPRHFLLTIGDKHSNL